MTKNDLVNAVCHLNPTFTRKTVEKAVSIVFNAITFYLSHHQRVELRGLGVFCVRKRPAHKAHNPQTGEMLFVPEKIVPFFKPSQNLKNVLKTSYGAVEAPKKGNFFTSIYRDMMGIS